MSAVPTWMIEGLTAEDYAAMPEEVCRTIEVVDGMVTVSPAPSRWHQDIAFNLAAALKSTCGPEQRVSIDIDLRLADVPLLNRRPDVVVYRAGVPNDQVLRPQDVILVVEITSPGSVTQVTIDKPGEYAAAGVRHYWRVAPEEATVYTYALNPRGDAYQLTGEHKGRLTVDQPVRLDVELAGLLRR
ncbi:MAG: Uma2 family endonuclease [Actinobacteria bacterium]|nr:Uma2 family endonuclease [Actinomycetota bacterium]